MRLLMSLIAAFSLSSLLSAQELSFPFEVQSWTRDCRSISDAEALNCSIPTQHLPVVQIATQVKIPTQAGQVQSESFPFESPEGLKGVIRLFATYPHESQKLPQYIQLQIEMIQPVRALCVQTVRLKDPMKFPPTTCTSLETPEKALETSNERPSVYKQYGFNLKHVH